MIIIMIITILPGGHGPGGGQTQRAEHVAALGAAPLPGDEGELGPAHVAADGGGRAPVPLRDVGSGGAPATHAP